MTEIPFQVALTMNNSAGELFGNRHLGVSVQRWTDLENFGEAVTLVDCMFEEMAFTGGGTVIIDLSAIDASSETELYQLALTLFCLTGANTKRVALVGATAELTGRPGFAQLVRRAQALEVTFVQSPDFSGAVALLNESAQGTNGQVLPHEAPVDGENTYGGSVSFWPTHTTVVLSLAGNDGNPGAVEHALQAALERVREKKAKVLLIDTSASAPVADSERLRFIFEQAIPSMLNVGLAYFIHVRPRGDKLIGASDAPAVSSVFRAAGISYERQYSIAEASLFLDKLAGHVPKTASASSALH